VIEIINLLGWTFGEDEADGQFVVVATFATSAELPDPRVRAHEVMHRMSMEDLYQTMSIEEVMINPTDKELGLKPKLAEVEQIDFVRAAYMQLVREASIAVPLWVNVAWLVHEIRANYDVGINYTGRTLTIVAKEDEVRIARVSTEDDLDAGFTETS
jgi:hypothetical protein